MIRRIQPSFIEPGSRQNVERRVWLVGHCKTCLEERERLVPVEFVAGCGWVLAGTWEPCNHQPEGEPQ